jgi:hypothetical protein
LLKDDCFCAILSSNVGVRPPPPPEPPPPEPPPEPPEPPPESPPPVQVPLIIQIIIPMIGGIIKCPVGSDSLLDYFPCNYSGLS